MRGSTIRKAAGRNLVLTHGGLRSQRAFYNLQAHNVLADADIARLPAIALGPLQVQDPTSVNFGKFYFLADYSDPDSGDILV